MSSPVDNEKKVPSLNLGKITLPKISLFGMISETLGFNQGISWSALALVVLIIGGATLFFVHSAPPTTITISAGPEGSVYYNWAKQYADKLKANGVTLKILTSEGSPENLQRLKDPSFHVDIGLVQDEVHLNKDELPKDFYGNLVSLGSVAYQPLLVFYRGNQVDSLSQFAGKQLGVGPIDSGTHKLVLQLLKANGIEPNDLTNTNMEGLTPGQAAQSLVDGNLDAVFLMGEDASADTMRKLLQTPEIKLMSFSQAEAYSRKFSSIRVLKFPQGVFDLGKNIPDHDCNLIGPTVEILARKSLHPALSDVLLEAVREVHCKAGVFQNKGDFPAPLLHDVPISEDATRFYKSGSSFFYKYLPFWLASLTSRFVVVFLPTFLILVPIARSIPQLYRWRLQSQIYRWYRGLLELERQLVNDSANGDRSQLLEQLNEIERSVNKMKVPAFFAEQFYVLRGHIDYVRSLISNSGASTGKSH